MIKQAPRQDGFLVLVAVALIVIVAFIGVALSFMVTGNLRGAVDQHDAARALFLAESGLEHGIYVWSTAATASGTNIPLGAGDFDFLVDKDSSAFPGYPNPLPAGQDRVLAVGRVGMARRSVEAIVQAGSSVGIGFDQASALSRPNHADLSWTHQVSGTDRYLLVGVSLRDGGVQVLPGGVTYAGTPLALLAVTAGAGARVELWGMAAPALGNNSIDVSLSAGTGVVAGAVSFTGVGQTVSTGGTGSTTGNGASASVSIVAGNANAWLVSVLATPSANVAPLAGQTGRWSDTSGGPPAGRVTGAGATVGPVAVGTSNLAWSITPSGDWALAAVEIVPVKDAAQILSWREVRP